VKDFSPGKKAIYLSWLVTLLSFLFLIIHLNRPSTLAFDETHYVPAARALNNAQTPLNLEHPPLSKSLIAVGMDLLGDNPLGWRILSTVFGAFTVGALTFWSFLLFQNLWISVFVAFLCLTNQMLYVQSRLAMIDPFLVGFLMWSFTLFSLWYKKKKDGILLVSAILGGLALACKWSALIPLFVMGLLVLRTKSLKNVLLYTFPLFSTYFLTFFPRARFESWTNILNWQKEMWDLQQRVPGTHGYQSSWWSWPLQIRPMWYTYTADPSGQNFEGIFLVGNPLILWAGVIAILYCFYEATKKDLRAREILLAYLVLYLSWAVVPRKLMFFYYYYPAALILSLALGLVLEKIMKENMKFAQIFAGTFCLISACLFVYFWPVLSSAMTSSQNLMKWIWFPGWL
jgi:dolichyl-phosphate-mannose--protein O-mannosyl transferase